MRSRYTVSTAQVRAAKSRAAETGEVVAVPSRDEDGIFRPLDVAQITLPPVVKPPHEASRTLLDSEALIFVHVDDAGAYRRRVGWGCTGPGLVLAAIYAGVLSQDLDGAAAYPHLYGSASLLLGVGIGYLIAAADSGPEAEAVTTGLPEDAAWAP